MSENQILLNRTKQDFILFLNLPFNTANEILNNDVSCTIVTWYLLQNSGDDILFVSDCVGYDAVLSDLGHRIEDYTEVTEHTVSAMIKAGLLKDNGIEWQDTDEPDVFERSLEKIYW